MKPFSARPPLHAASARPPPLRSPLAARRALSGLGSPCGRMASGRARAERLPSLPARSVPAVTDRVDAEAVAAYYMRVHWEKMFAELEAYEKAHGGAWPTKEWWDSHPGALWWARRARLQARQGKLQKSQIERLDALGFQWDA